MDKLIMVLPATYWQIPLVNKIKEMGYKTLSVNLYENSPAFEYSDYHEVANILDKEKCLEIAQKYNIDAILSDECDIAMPTVAYIAEKLGLPSLGSRCASLYTNKLLMREFCTKHKLPSVNYRLCKTEEEAESFYKDLGCDIILKPLDSNSSHGVFRITSQEQIREKFSESLSFSKVEKAVLAERFVDGTEFTVDGLNTPEGHLTLAISEKKHFTHNVNIANELFFSHYNSQYDYNKLRELNNRFVELSNLPIGIFTHAEYKYQDGEFFLIEIGARGGGNLISAVIVPLMSGVDNYKYLINASLGEKTESPFINEAYKDRCSVLYFFSTPNGGGKVAKIEGLDFLDCNSHIVKYAFNFKVGDVIKNAVSDSARIGYYIAYTNSKNELELLMNEINERVKIIYENE